MTTVAKMKTASRFAILALVLSVPATGEDFLKPPVISARSYVSGSSKILVTVSQDEVGITVSRGKWVATAGAEAVTGLGKVDIEFAFTTGS